MSGMKAMVLAAGLGERMGPLTVQLPKPMLPIANRPVMIYILEHLARHGFTELIANTHYLAEQIVDYCGDGSRYGVHLCYSHEEKLWGIAGGVRRCKDFFQDDTFLVMGADDLTDMDLTALLAEHRRVGAIASIGLVEVEDTSQYGIVVTDAEGRIERFVEKPKEAPPSRTANTQIYLFEPQIMDFIPPNQVYDFGFHVFPDLVARGAPFYGFRLPGYWRDIGSIKDYLGAHQDVLEQRVSVRLEGNEVSPGIWMGRNCQIHQEAKLSAPLILGDRCQVKEKAELGGATAMGDEVEVPPASSLQNCVVWSGAAVPAGIALNRAVITARGIYQG